MSKWSAPIAAGIMGFAFAFGGVYLNAREGTSVQAQPDTTEPFDPVVLVQRALLADAKSLTEAQERLRPVPVPVQADAPDRPSWSTYKDRRNLRRSPFGGHATTD